MAELTVSPPYSGASRSRPPANTTIAPARSRNDSSASGSASTERSHAAHDVVSSREASGCDHGSSGSTVAVLGVAPPAVLKGYTQSPIEGQSFVSSLTDPEAPERETQFYSMLGMRAIYHRG